VTTVKHPDDASIREMSRPAKRTEQDDPPETLAVSPVVLAQVLAHLRGRARSHPDSPATGVYPMSADQWRICITELRRRDYRITESIATRGDRAANEIGYTLADEPPRGVRLSASANPPVGLRRLPGSSAERSHALAP
jgi:hypothetical protein